MQDKAHSYNVGDILISVWGYDQTNVDYYQVTKLCGRTMIEITPIEGDYRGEGFMCGHTRPQPGKFMDPERYPPRRVKAKDGGFNLRSWGMFCRKLEPSAACPVTGVPIYPSHYESHYA